MNNLDMHRWHKMYSIWMKMLSTQEVPTSFLKSIQRSVVLELSPYI